MPSVVNGCDIVASVFDPDKFAQGSRWRLGQAKVHQLRSRLGQHDVARLQVAMDHAAAVRLFQPVADLRPNTEHLLQRQPALAQALAQRLAFQVFHDEVTDPVLLADVVEVANVGMAQRRNRARLTVKSLFCLRVAERCAGRILTATVRSRRVSRAR